MNQIVHTTSTPTCSCAWCQRVEPWRSRWAQCIQVGWMRVWDAVDSGSAQLIPDVHPANPDHDHYRTCRACAYDEHVSRRYEYLGSWWVNLECGHTQNDDEH